MRPPLPPPSLAGQRWLITGANRGIGFETAAALAARRGGGATVASSFREQLRELVGLLDRRGGW